MSGTVAKSGQASHPPGALHALGLVAGWVLITAAAEFVLFVFWFATTIAVFSTAGPVATAFGVGVAILALAVAPLACAYLVRRGDRWLSADK